MIEQEIIFRGYLTRYLKKLLNYKRTVFLLGQKGCGKSTTCSLKMKSSVDLRLKGRKNIRLATSEISHSNFIDKSIKPFMIDEWKQVPSLKDKIKDIVDNNENRGQYILISIYRKVR